MALGTFPPTPKLPSGTTAPSDTTAPSSPDPMLVELQEAEERARRSTRNTYILAGGVVLGAILWDASRRKRVRA